ncbi:trithorax group protein osa [Oryzias melastigma]|uniref:trithorax group protein osa n=1 Tax=Oryzias melastigma TaxID=30732 RepID=UPI000CF7F2E6|nr:trithorax group protein osa [Oryzias melastigma]
MPWQQVAPHTPTYSVRYTSPTPPYSGAPPPSSQGYHSGQAPVHPLYPSGPQYPPFNLGYQSSPVPEDLQLRPEPLEQLQPPNGDAMAGHAHLRAAMAPPDSPASANVANANNRAMLLPAGFGQKKESGENTTRTVLLVDPPLNNKPILAVVSNPDMKDVPFKPSGSSGSSPIYRHIRNRGSPYHPLGGAEPGQQGYPVTVTMTEPLSVACSTEDSWEEEGLRPGPGMGPGAGMGPSRSYRGPGGRGRRGHDAGRGGPRRRYTDMEVRQSYVQYNSSFKGRGRERGY